MKRQLLALLTASLVTTGLFVVPANAAEAATTTSASSTQSTALTFTWKQTSASATDGNVWALSWNAVPNATRYVVTYQEDGYPAAESRTISAPALSTSWRYAEDYTFGKVTAYNAAGQVITSAAIPTLPAINPAPVPVEFSWKQTSTSTTNGNVWELTWKPIPGATRYTVTYQEDGYPAQETRTISAPATSTNWRYAEDYTFGQLTAYNSAGQVITTGRIPVLPASTTPAPTQPATPVLEFTWTRTSASATTGDVWQLAWKAIPGATRYTVTYQEDGYPAQETRTISAPATSTNWRYAEDYTFGKVTAYNSAGQVITSKAIPTLPAPPTTAPAPTVERIAGADRYTTAVALSKKYNVASITNTVYLVSGEKFPDALSVAPAAAQYGKALLLTASGSLPASVATELKRLNPAQVVIVGGVDTISNTVLNSVKTSLPKAAVQRVAGSDRWTTSILTAKLAFPTATEAFIASGETYQNALTAGPVAGTKKAPVLLTSTGNIPASLRQHLATAGYKKITIVGGTNTVSATAFNSIKAAAPGATVVRIAGTNDFNTNLLVNRLAPTTKTGVVLASSEKFTDALAGAAVANKVGQLLLTSPTCVPVPTFDAIKNTYKATNIVVLGGTDTLSANVANLKTCS